MSDERALLAAIWEHPRDDTPRLVYADWLLMRGRPEDVARAEFIWVQCELAKMDLDEREESETRKRERQLWNWYGPKWQAELRKPFRRFPFHRGFVRPRDRLSAEEFRTLPWDAFEAAPLWDIDLTSLDRVVSGFSTCRNLSRIGKLRLYVVEPSMVADLLQSPHLCNLDALELAGDRVGSEGFRALTANAAVCHLESLALDSADVSDEALTQLTGAPQFSSLQDLRIASDLYGDAGLQAVASSPHLSGVTSLVLTSKYPTNYRKRLSANGLGFLGASPHLSALQHLYLFTSLGPAEMSALCSTQPSFSLRTLNLDDCRISDEGAITLAQWPGLASVTVLSLWHNSIGRDGALALAQSSHLDQLRELRVHGNPLTHEHGEEGLIALMSRFREKLDIK